MVIMVGYESADNLTHDLVSPYTFVQALRDKYINQEVLDDRLILPGGRDIGIDIMLVGFGKVTCTQRQLKGLRSLDLSGRTIREVGDMNELKGHLDRIQILNLANNFVKWSHVAAIISFLPSLKELILTKNQSLVSDTTLITQDSPKPKINCLSLGRVQMIWSDVLEITAKIWDSIEQLDLWDNCLCDEKMTVEDHSKLQHFVAGIKGLKLSHNRFHDLDWILNAGALDNLLEIDISSCGLLSCEISENLAKKLQRLMRLNISYNDICDWVSVSSLNSLRSLQELVCFENPFYISEKLARSLVIGRVKNLKILNREEIKPNQRRDSEILYLRRTFPDYKSSLQASNHEFHRLHPRYPELLELYGVPEDLNEKKADDRFINITLSFEGKKICRKLPRDMRVTDLKTLSKRLFGLKPHTFISVTCQDSCPSSKGISYELDKDGHTLNFFSIQSDHILVIEDMNK